MATCCAATAPALPAGVATCSLFCATVCSPLTVGCLSDDVVTQEVGSDGEVRKVAVQHLEPGKEVLTLSEGRLVATRVLQNQRSEGNFVFTELGVEQGGKYFNLTVTNEHNMVRLRGGESSVNRAGENNWEVLLAAQLKVGDLIPADARAAGSVGLARIAQVRQMELGVKNTVVTESGTMLANGLLITTICDGELAGGSPLSLNATLQKWRRLHESAATCAAVLAI